jgi:Tfp pilus assembly protein PilV
MTRDIRGTSSIEALLATVVFSILAVAAAGLAALSLRTAAAAARASRAGRLTGEVAESLAALSAPDRDCRDFLADQSTAPGVTARWSFQPALHGLEVLIETRYRTASGPHADSGWSFVRCR